MTWFLIGSHMNINDGIIMLNAKVLQSSECLDIHVKCQGMFMMLIHHQFCLELVLGFH